MTTSDAVLDRVTLDCVPPTMCSKATTLITTLINSRRDTPCTDSADDATGRPGAGDEKLGVLIPRLEPGNEGPPAALQADPDAVFAEDCPVSPPKTALAQSNALGVWGVSARAFGVDFRLSF